MPRTISSLNQLLILGIIVLFTGCGEKTDSLVIISTPYGEMKAILYDETPLHKENFLSLAKEGKYDSVTFHRVIENFMIQTGDLSTGKLEKDAEHRIDAEFLPDRFIHEKGALAAARYGDAQNPYKKSSGSQFYIVDGATYDEEGLKKRGEYREYLRLHGYFERLKKVDRYSELNEKYNYHVQKSQEDSTYNWGEALQGLVYSSKDIIEKEFGPQVDPGFNAFQRQRYAEVGGAPHLDGEYTVFGRVVEGLDVIDKIAAVETSYTDKPLQEIRMFVRIEEVPISELAEKYGLESPSNN